MPSDVKIDNRFGGAVALQGELAAGGAVGNDAPVFNSGAAYLFTQRVPQG